MENFDFNIDFNADFGIKGFGLGNQKQEESEESKQARRLRELKRLEVRGQALDNLFKLNPGGDNDYGIPITTPFTDDLSGVEWIDFNNKQKITDPANTAVHFYIQDYLFSVVWNQPDKYIPLFQKLKAVVTPDFSNYTDMPGAQDIWNCYRRQWCGAYWQSHGVSVISSLSWGVGKIYDWTFAGIPQGTICATSFVCGNLDRDMAVDELLMVIEKVQPQRLFVKCSKKDEEYLRKYIDFTVIPPYNWRKVGNAKRE